MMTSSLTPVNNANQSYVAFLNLQTGKCILYLRNNYFFFTKYYFVLTKYYFVKTKYYFVKTKYYFVKAK